MVVAPGRCPSREGEVESPSPRAGAQGMVHACAFLLVVLGVSHLHLTYSAPIVRIRTLPGFAPL